MPKSIMQSIVGAKKKHVYVLIYTSILTAFLASLFLVERVADADRWNAYTHVSTSAVPGGEMILRLGHRIETEVPGDLSVSVHLGGSLPIKADDIPQAVGDGVMQLGVLGFVSGHVPVADLLRLPLLLNTNEDYETAMRVMRPVIEQKFEGLGLKVLSYYTYDSVTLFTTKPVERLGQLGGLKIRQTGRHTAYFLRTFNSIPISLGAEEVAAGLQQGVIDGAVTSSSGGGRIWGDLIDYNYRLELYRPENWIVINVDTWSRLDATQQNYLQRIAEEEAALATAKNNADEIAVMEDHIDQGIVVVSSTDQDLYDARTLMEPHWEEWAVETGSEAIELLREVKSALSNAAGE